jgi:prophage regulatory protein
MNANDATLATPTTDLDRLMSWPEVQAHVRLSRVGVWKLRAAGEFPKPLKVSANRVLWKMSEIRAWIETRERA